MEVTSHSVITCSAGRLSAYVVPALGLSNEC